MAFLNNRLLRLIALWFDRQLTPMRFVVLFVWLYRRTFRTMFLRMIAGGAKEVAEDESAVAQVQRLLAVQWFKADLPSVEMLESVLERCNGQLQKVEQREPQNMLVDPSVRHQNMVWLATLACHRECWMGGSPPSLQVEINGFAVDWHPQGFFVKLRVTAFHGNVEIPTIASGRHHCSLWIIKRGSGWDREVLETRLNEFISATHPWPWHGQLTGRLTGMTRDLLKTSYYLILDNSWHEQILVQLASEGNWIWFNSWREEQQLSTRKGNRSLEKSPIGALHVAL